MTTATDPTAREPSPPPATGASGICTRHHGTSGTPPSTQQAKDHVAAGQSGGQPVDATATHGAPLLSAATIARQADGYPHHLLAMWAPRAGHPMAPHPVTGALPPHANGPRYPGTALVAAHALRTGRRE